MFTFYNGKHKPIVYVYRGTFDPFHKNHEAVCRWCLDQPDTQGLVIHINSLTHGKLSTKNPAEWWSRYRIVRAVLQEQAIIRPAETFDRTLQWANDFYGHDKVEIIEIFGSDVLERIVDKPLITAYAQHVRTHDDKKHAITELHHKPLRTIPLYLPSISSTKVRSLLMQGRLQDAASMLPKNALDCISTMEDYSPLAISIRELKLKGFPISNVLSSKLALNFRNRAYLEDNTQQYQGRSGDAIITVRKNQKIIAMCKSFHSGNKACKTEVDNHRWMARFSRVPLIYFSCDNWVCMQHVDGKTPETTDDFTQVGHAYHDLHHKSLHLLNATSDTSENSKLQQKIANVCQRISNPQLVTRIVRIFNALFSVYIKSSHRKSTIHGDAQPGNVLLKSNQVTFIDFEKVKQKHDPARDVNQMVASIYWKAYQQNKTDIDDIPMIKDQIAAFLQGYSYRLVTAADRFWNFYWSVKTMELAQNRPQLPLSQHLIVEFDKTLTEYEFYTQYDANRFFTSRVEEINHSSQLQQATRPSTTFH